MNSFLLSFIPFVMNADNSGVWTLIGFGGLLLVLLMILKEGKPRSTPQVIQTQTPQQWTDDPKFADARRRAVAVAYAYHQHNQAKGSSE